MIKFIIIVTFLLVAFPCVAQQKTALIDSAIKATYNSNPDVGISVGLVHESTRYFFNYGTVSRTVSQRVDSITTFEIGSITKLFTSYLIAQQAQAGRISLDSFVDEYLPPQVKLNPKIQSKIKVSDLASHQSGLPDFDMLRLLQLNPVQPLDEVTTEMVDSILVHTSDLESLGAYQYSNISYVLLGYILENVVGSNYEKIVNNNLLKPLKMKNTFTSDFSSGISTMGYDFQNNKRGFLNWNSVIAPAGLLKSNTSDMLKFIQFLLATDDKEILRKIQKTYFKNTFIELGLGLNILRDSDNVVYAKSGDSVGQSSVLAYNKQKNWGVIILTNQASGIARQLFSEITIILN